MTTAFVLSGGGSLGAVQVGMLRALVRHGVMPDLVVGTSIGGLNGTALLPNRPRRAWTRWRGRGGRSSATMYPLAPDEALRALARSLPWHPVRGTLRALGVLNSAFPVRPAAALLGAVGLTDHLVPSGPRERMLARRVPLQRLEEAKLPLTVTATEVTTERLVRLSSGPAVPALLATSAVPGVFEPVTIDGRALMDGGVADDTALDVATAEGADEVYVLPTGFSCDLPEPPPTALGMTVHALAMLLEQRLIEAARNAPQHVSLNIVPPLCPLSVLPVDFGHSEELIERADASTQEWLAGGRQGLPAGTRSLGDVGHDARSSMPRSHSPESAAPAGGAHERHQG